MSRKWVCLVFTVSAAVAGPQQPSDNDPVLTPGEQQIPAWAQQGRFRFTRLDGGPIEILKTSRSAWGMHFSQQEKEVLGNLYTKYGDRMLDLLEQAHINWVWLTWSVGYSWQDEAEQRAQCQRFVARLRQRGIRTAAYVCAVSMFWESMFRDEPRSVRWIAFDPKGFPFRYSGGRDPLRFIADVSNPEWVELQKRRVGAAIDAGFDALFFDNTASVGWSSDEQIDAFIGKIRRFIHDEKRSNLLLLTNYGLTPARAALNRNMEVVFAEGWREPGVWSGEWNVSNIRRTKYLRGLIPAGKPLTTEYSIFHEGNRATTFLGPRSQKLATAEAAAFHSDYSWDMEGPFDAALMAKAPAALESWRAIGEYGRFLREHEDLYRNARPVSPIAVVAPSNGVTFTWDRDDSGLYDLLAKNSILFDIRPAREALHYAAVVIPPSAGSIPIPHGARVYSPRAGAAADEILAGVRALVPEALSVSIEDAPRVLANLTRLGSGKGLALHLLNYAPGAVSAVRVRVHLDREFAPLAKATPRVFTPDRAAQGAVRAHRTNLAIEFSLDKLDVYSVVTLER
jgi:hypothetical protein